MEFRKCSFHVNETIGFEKMYVWRKRNECFSKLGRPRSCAGSGPGPAQHNLGWRREMMPRTSGAAENATWRGTHSKVSCNGGRHLFRSRDCNAFRRRGMTFFSRSEKCVVPLGHPACGHP